MKAETVELPREGDHVMLTGRDDTAGYIVEVNKIGAIRVDCGDGQGYWTFPNHVTKIKSLTY